MKQLLVILLVVLLAPSVFAQDMRDVYQKAQQARQTAEETAKAAEIKILNDRTALLAAVERLEAEKEALESTLSQNEQLIEAQELKRDDLQEQWSRSELEFKEISGNVRVAAKDLEAMLRQSHFTAFDQERLDGVQRLVDPGYFPDIEDISGLVAVAFGEIKQSGQVAMRDVEIVNRSGATESTSVFTLGRFTAVYSDGVESGFLNYSQDGQRFVALTKLPSGGVGKDLERYLAGEGEVVPLDMSMGNALRTITHRTNFRDQLLAGGPLVWPIAFLALIALLIIIYKAIDLNRVGLGTERLMERIQDSVNAGRWDEVEGELEKSSGGSPIIHVIREGLKVRGEDRETQESVLQEAILSRLPRVERGLSFLAVLGAVAPLLGLLGTVTGMIETFRVITLFGTGDPKLMSGGISEALITTELGLIVSIPIMIVHTLLSRRSDRIIGAMEEKAVHLVNILQMKQKLKTMVAQAGG